MESVCIFAGARTGINENFVKAAQELGRVLGGKGLHVIYGGSNLGLMEIVASSAMEAGAHVTGISAVPVQRPESIGLHVPCHKLIIAETMQARRQLMYELSDAIIALPGGIGTLEELMEVWSWKHLGLHTKPIGLLNVDRCWSPLLSYIDKLRKDGLVRANKTLDPIVSNQSEDLVSKLIGRAK